MMVNWYISIIHKIIYILLLVILLVLVMKSFEHNYKKKKNGPEHVQIPIKLDKYYRTAYCINKSAYMNTGVNIQMQLLGTFKFKYHISSDFVRYYIYFIHTVCTCYCSNYVRMHNIIILTILTVNRKQE